MTVQEAIQLAENGDIGAMLMLGDYFMTEENRDTDEAKKWYIAAAEKGVPYAAHMASLVCGIIAPMSIVTMNIMEDNEFMYEFVLDEWLDAYKWIDKTIMYKQQDAPNTENIDLNEYFAKKKEAAYYCGLLSCCSGKMDEALKYLEGLSDLNSRLILGHVHFQKAEADEEYVKALREMNQVLIDKEFIEKSKNKAEEAVLAVSAIQVATGYEFGVGVSENPNVDKAIELLTCVRNTCKQEKNKEKLSGKIRDLQQKKAVSQQGMSNTSVNNNSSGGCYVATAVYGSYDCPQVWTLRRYRDDILASTWYGRTFIRMYYAVSPTLVKWFGHTEWFKSMWKEKLDYMVEVLQNKGFDNTPYDDREW